MLAPDAGADERQAAESRHRTLLQRIEAAGGRTASRIETGDPDAIISRAGEDGYSLIVVGKHGRNWIDSKIIGSTAAHVCEIARRPVLMVPLGKN